MAKKIAQVVDDVGITTAVMASEIQSIGKAVRRLRAGKINEDALVLLIQHAAPTVRRPGSGYGKAAVTIKAIRAVLDGMENLEKAWLKKKPQTP